MPSIPEQGYRFRSVSGNIGTTEPETEMLLAGQQWSLRLPGKSARLPLIPVDYQFNIVLYLLLFGLWTMANEKMDIISVFIYFFNISNLVFI